MSGVDSDEDPGVDSDEVPVVESDEVGTLGVDELSVGNVTVTVVPSDVVGVTVEGLDDSELVGVTQGVGDPVGPLGVGVTLQV